MTRPNHCLAPMVALRTDDARRQQTGWVCLECGHAQFLKPSVPPPSYDTVSKPRGNRRRAQDPNALNDTLAQQLSVSEDCGGFIREYAFCPGRNYRADFAWPEARLLVEVQGYGGTVGGHTSVLGQEHDCEKLNHATLLEWRVLWVNGKMVKDGRALDWIERALGGGDE